jgi:hypothetical protein
MTRDSDQAKGLEKQTKEKAHRRIVFIELSKRRCRSTASSGIRTQMNYTSVTGGAFGAMDREAPSCERAAKVAASEEESEEPMKI